jgi:transcriptional regulator with XRE-family HTH domain
MRMPKRIEDYENDPAYSVLQKETGLRIAAIRNLAGLTQGQVIKNLGVSQSAWSKWENGIRMADVFVMTRFAARFKVSLDLIYRGMPTTSHPGVVQLLRAAAPELVVEETTGKEPDMDTLRASYRAAISQN